MARYFVTGGTGYLGSTLIELLLKNGHTVVALVRRPERADVLAEGVEQVAGDLSNEDAMARGMEGCDGVFHLAASVGGTLEATREFNTEGTRNVLRAAKSAGVPRIVHTSSSAAIITREGIVSENHTGDTALIDPYSVTKAEAERVIFEAVAAGQDVRICNVVNAYGYSPRGAMSYNLLIRAACEGELKTVVDARVGWVLAEDVAKGHLLAFEQGEPGKRYVLCGEVATFSTFLGAARRLWGSTTPLEILPPGSDLPNDGHFFARRSEVYGKLGPVSTEDANARALGFTAAGIESGLAATIPWIKAAGRAGVSCLHTPVR
jgi:dihydroflavonol-4-reductase